MDPFGMGQTLPPLQVPQPTAQTTIVPPLKKPPKWVRRPVGASFAVSAPPHPCFTPSYHSSRPLNLNDDVPFDSASLSLKMYFKDFVLCCCSGKLITAHQLS